jgi:hypothetical protein
MKMPSTQFTESFNKTVKFCLECAVTAPGELYNDFVNIKEIYVNKEVLRMLNEESFKQNRTQSQKTRDPKGPQIKCDTAQFDSLIGTYGADISAPTSDKGVISDKYDYLPF